MNGQRWQFTPDQADELETLEQWSIAVDAAIANNCNQILLEKEAEQRKNNNEWQNDDDDDKTIKPSNKWKDQAVYMARENHDGDQNNYCPGQDFSLVSEE